MTMRPLRFLRRGRLVEIDSFHPRTTLLEWLRLEERSTGTKEGCAEGDCGACTVVLARLRRGQVVYHPVNACIMLLGQVDGAEVITIEDLAEGDSLHPVQSAMVENHASQCGFCTPGIVMSLFALSHSGKMLDRGSVTQSLAGNLCRCTGYRPIVEAALGACQGPVHDRFSATMQASAQVLAALDDDTTMFSGSEEVFFAAPRSEAFLAALIERYPEATLLGGGTDVGLWVTKDLRDLKQIIWLGRVNSLQEIEVHQDRLLLGAGVTLEEAMPSLGAIDPDLQTLMQRFGSTQIRTSGTVGGNIANGSPIGDLAPALIALGAVIELGRSGETRSIPLQDFFLAYRHQDRRTGEYLRALHIPLLSEGTHFRAFKISKRYEEDISSVLVAIRLTLLDGHIVDVRIACGGMAGTPRRATHVEQALLGQPIASSVTWKTAGDTLPNDFAPMDDHRASAKYRMQVARATLIKALAEIAGLPTENTRIYPRRERVAAHG
jgi:xanthine dehydrogenase small subunit